MSFSKLKTKIGIIGGGQLGKMMILEAKKMGFYVITLDPTPDCPSHSISDEHIIADFDDKESIKLLSEKSDVITYEFEHIDAKTLTQLENQGKKVYPTAKSLTIIQNKLSQKTILRENKIPVPDFFEISNLEELNKISEKIEFPFLLKTCEGGYDGKGNYLVREREHIKEGFSFLDGNKNKLMAESFVDFDMEVSVLACRGINGEIKVYPVAENIHKDNILRKTKVPANINEKSSQKAMDMAWKVMDIFKGVGMFCIEMFVKDDDIYINEVAPRPHNSGHYTIEACVTSQFEQHIRAITGLPLGDSSLVSPVVMRNILGEEGFVGDAKVIGVDECLSLKGVKLHIYGKSKTSPKRKMGHLTVINKDLEMASEISKKAHDFIKVIS